MQSLSEIIREAQNGDSGALDTLVRRYSVTVRQECTKYGATNCGDFSHSDLMQEVLFRVWTKIDQFRGVDGDDSTAIAFESWIRKTARTTLSNFYRNHGVQKRVPENGIQPFDERGQEYQQHRGQQTGPSSNFVKDEEAQRLREALDQFLDDRSREILSRFMVEGQNLKQISEQMKLSYDQARYAFHAALDELKKRLS